MSFFDWLAHLPPALVWGLVERGVGAVYLVAFASLSTQAVAMAGKNGIAPVAPALSLIERDFPTWKRFAYFPTLLWFSASDGFLAGLSWLGVIASLVGIVGGPAAPWALGACYVLYLSLDRALVLIYPWDCVLLEAGFWGFFLPATHLLPVVTATSAPDPAVAWVFRLLVFRVMFGFGKHKFIGATAQDRRYLKGFYISQPIPSVLGWLSHRAPLWMLDAALGLMFVAEVPGPFTVFAPGIWSAAGAALVIILMIGIWVGGTFGFFNLILIVLSVSWFDSETPRALSLSHYWSQPGSIWVHALVFIHMTGVLLSLSFNSFCAHTWMQWPMWLRIRPRILTLPITVVRALHPLRWLHAYGVFPPHSPPAAKMVPTLEVTWDGDAWHAIELKYWPVLATSRPRSCAPHHPRLDQAVLYEAFGVSEASVTRNFMGRWEPYGYGRITGGSLVMRAMLTGNAADSLIHPDALRGHTERPIAARMRSYLLTPAPLSEPRRTGTWWVRTLVGPHLPPATRDEPAWDNPIPPPELWHPEDVIWLRRSHLGPMMKEAARGGSVHALVLRDGGDLRDDHLAAFWGDFLTTAAASSTRTLSGLRPTVARVRQTYDRQTLHRFERIAGRYAVLLSAKLERLFLDKGILPAFGLATATLNVKTHYHLRLLAYHIVASGRAAYDAVIAAPETAAPFADSMTMASGHYLLAIFSYEWFLFQSQKLRALACFVEHEGRPPLTPAGQRAAERTQSVVRRLWGVIDVVEFLKTQFATEEDILDIPENWPRFRIDAHGVVTQIE